MIRDDIEPRIGGVLIAGQFTEWKSTGKSNGRSALRSGIAEPQELMGRITLRPILPVGSWQILLQKALAYFVRSDFCDPDAIRYGGDR